MQIEGSVVLITGASQGIGAACAAAFQKRGARLALLARNEEKLRAVAGHSGNGALVLAGDVTDPAFREHAVARTLQTFGAIDVLINNAGTGLYLPAWRATEAQARELFDLNFFAPLALSQLVVPSMRQRGRGMLVNISSIAGEITLPWFTLYSASKFALGSLTAGLRMELERDGIRAMTVCPGYVNTDFQKHVIAGSSPASIKRARPLSVSVQDCAEAIVRGVERDARMVVTPRSGWAVIWLRRFFPAIVDRRLSRMQERQS
jgi:short-subunit dehydrogenase